MTPETLEKLFDEKLNTVKEMIKNLDEKIKVANKRLADLERKHEEVDKKQQGITLDVAEHAPEIAFIRKHRLILSAIIIVATIGGGGGAIKSHLDKKELIEMINQAHTPPIRKLKD